MDIQKQYNPERELERQDVEEELDYILRAYGEEAYLEACERLGYNEPESTGKSSGPDSWWPD